MVPIVSDYRVVSDYRALLYGSYWFPISSEAAPIVATPQPVVLTYSFTEGDGMTFSASDEAVARTELQQWAQVSGVTFLETTASEGDITFGYHDLTAMGYTHTAGLAHYPSSGASITSTGTLQTYDSVVTVAGDIYVDSSYADTPSLQADLGHVLVHEIGHALGLKHPFDDGAYTLDAALDNGSETVMSYSGVRAAVLGPLDVAAVQAIYGQYGAAPASWDWSWDAADEIYTISSAGDGQYLRGVGAVSDIVYAPGLHDAVVTAGGDDAIHADGQPLSISAGPGHDIVYTGLTYAGLPGGVRHFLDESDQPIADATYVQDAGGFQKYFGVETLVFGDGVYTTANDSFTPLVPLTVMAEHDALAEGGGPLVFELTRTGSTAAARVAAWAVTGRVAVGNNAALADAADFSGGVLPSGQVSFAAGQVRQYVTVALNDDALVEADEQFTLQLRDPGTGVEEGGATATILNDDTPATLSIAALYANKAEGDSGATPFVFTVTRSGDVSGVSRVGWQVIGGLSSSANPHDFVGGVVPSGAVTFAGGETSEVITVDVAGDTASEADEQFRVVLGHSVGATIGTVGATATILNDDTPGASLAIAASDASKAEGDSGATPFVFTVTRSGDVSGVSSVDWQVIGGLSGSANPHDFAGGVVPSGAVTFGAGVASRMITVDVAGDTASEADEQFRVVLGHSVGATIGTVGATATILNDDGGAAPDIRGALTAVATADFNGDGTADMLRQASGGDLYVLDGASGVQSPVTQAAAGLSFVAAADFDGDGRSDLLLQGSGGGLYGWMMSGASVRQADLVTMPGSGQTVAGVRDYTGDGRADILLADAPPQAGAAGGWTLLEMHGGTIAGITHPAGPADASGMG